MSDKVIIPCPYCGGYAKLECQHGQYVVFCISTRCLVEPCTPYYNTPEEAIEAWNSRVSPSPVTPERLAELLLQCGLTPFCFHRFKICSGRSQTNGKTKGK
jgi:hypothetical protein